MDAANVAWNTLRDLSAGKPFIPILPDGREGEPQVPSATIRMKASIEILDRLYGKAPTAAEKMEEAKTVEANTVHQLEDLTDAELVDHVRSALHVLEQPPADENPSGDGE